MVGDAAKSLIPNELCSEDLSAITAGGSGRARSIPESKKDAARLLLQARTRAGLAQCEIAARAHTSQSVIARIERGQATPGVETLDHHLAAAGFDDLARGAVQFDVNGAVLHVARLEDIIRSKIAADRPQDRQDVSVMRELLGRGQARPS